MADIKNIMEEIAQEMSEANKAKVQATLPATTEEVVVDTPTEPIVVDSSLTPEITEPIVTETPVTETPIPSKTLEETLAEWTGGKVKSKEDIEQLLTPKELKFANPEIARLNELVEQGVALDEEFWKLQSKDFKSLDPEQVLIEAMRQDKNYQGWTDKELKLELDDKYKRKEWGEEGEIPTDAELLARKRYERDVAIEREKLNQLKESRTVVRKPNEADIQARAQAEAKMQKEWEQVIESSVIPKADKLSTLIDEKSNDRVDFAVPESDKKEVLDVMKQMRTNLEPFWNQFKNPKGEFDYNKIYDLLILSKHKDNLVKIVAQNYKAKGAEEEVKRIKNINFKSDGVKTTVDKTVKEKNAEAVDIAMRKAGLLK